MKRRLCFYDIKEGKKYKIIAKPPHWPNNQNYVNLGKIGVVKWANYHGVNLLIEGRYERMVMAECLEEVPNEPKSMIESNMELNEDNIKIGGRYQIVKTPRFWPKDKTYADLGRVGRIKRITGEVCLLTMGNANEQRLLTFDCIKEVQPVEIDERYLIKQIEGNPWGAMKLIKGLAKMNKDMGCRAFVERGIL